MSASNREPFAVSAIWLKIAPDGTTIVEVETRHGWTEIVRSSGPITSEIVEAAEIRRCVANAWCHKSVTWDAYGPKTLCAGPANHDGKCANPWVGP